MNKYIINGNEYEATVNNFSGNRAEVTVNGVTYNVEICSKYSHMPTPAVSESANLASEATASVTQESIPARSEGGKKVTSPLPGVVVGVKVKVGDKVKCGQVLAVLEAMKMENEIQSEFDGVVTSVNVNSGDSVLEGETLVTIG